MLIVSFLFHLLIVLLFYSIMLVVTFNRRQVFVVIIHFLTYDLLLYLLST